MAYIFLLWLSESLTLSFRYKHLILTVPIALRCASQVNKMCTWISLDGFITICALCETHRLSTFPGFIWAVNPKQLQQNAPSNHLHRIYPHRSPSIVLAGLFVSDCDLPPSTQYYFISLRFSFVSQLYGLCIVFMQTTCVTLNIVTPNKCYTIVVHKICNVLINTKNRRLSYRKTVCARVTISCM